MNAGRVSGALLTQSGCHPVPGMTVGVISGMCPGKVHAYAVTVNRGQGAVMGKPSGIQPHLPTALMPGRQGGPQGLIQTFPPACSWLPDPPAPGPPPGACPLLPQCRPTQAAPGWVQGCAWGSWLSQSQPWPWALFLLAPSWRYFCPVLS